MWIEADWESPIVSVRKVHDAILTVDKNLTLIPSLAWSFEQSLDLLTYTLHLRPRAATAAVDADSA
jgi:hypothetical protein